MAVNLGTAAVRADVAGIIASRNGKATAAPVPRRRVRLDNANFRITIGCLLNSVCFLLRHSHLKRYTSHNTLNQGGESKAFDASLPLDLTDRRRIAGFEPASERVGQKLFRNGRIKFVGMF